MSAVTHGFAVGGTEAAKTQSQSRQEKAGGRTCVSRGLSRLAGISLVLVVGMVVAACSSTPKAATTTTTSGVSQRAVRL